MKTKAEQIYEAIGEGFGFNGSKDQAIEVIETILNAETPFNVDDASSLTLLKALGDLLSGDCGCPMCDWGVLRSPDKEHSDNCKWHNAQKVYDSCRKQNHQS